MKPFLLFTFLYLAFSSNAQTKIYEDNNYVTFNLKYAKDTTTVDGIDWEKEKLFSEFTLKGKKDIKYAISIKNQYSASLLLLNNGKWKIQEKINITGLTLRRIANKVIISEFHITDFNNDGNEDIVCWADTNINSNKWSLIYLNDNENQKLVKLWNDADKTDIWARPLYDTETSTIRTERDGSVNGTSDECLFILDGIDALPVSKHYQDRTGDRAIDYYYSGNNDKWELQQTFQDNTRNVVFNFPKGINNIEDINWKKENLSSEFILNGNSQLKMKIALISDSEAVLYEFKDNQWINREQLYWFEWPDGYDQKEGFTYSFKITDFDRDGNEDLVCWTHTNVNGNEWTNIYLNDPKTKSLVKLENADEDVWASPEFDKLTNTIICNTVSGAFGKSYISTYTLEGLIAAPISKKETDFSEIANNPSDTGLLRIYKGENSLWKLVSEEKVKPEIENNN